jgi:hypothetical protein
MTSMEREIGKPISVVDVAREIEEFVRQRFHELQCNEGAHAVSH